MWAHASKADAEIAVEYVERMALAHLKLESSGEDRLHLDNLENLLEHASLLFDSKEVVDGWSLLNTKVVWDRTVNVVWKVDQ